MRRRNSTEATVKRVAMTSDIKVGEPLKPEEVIEYEVPDKEITDVKEAFDCILKMAGEGCTADDYIKESGYKLWKDSEGNSMIMSVGTGRVINDIIRDYLEKKYAGRFAYIKKGDRELYGKVYVRPYDSIMNTPYGRVHCPIVTVDSVPVFCPVNKLLSEEQVQTYELYNGKAEDFDRLELEKKIMADLITYSQLGVKNIQDSKAVFDKIQAECEKIGTVKGLRFQDGVFEIQFDWRLLNDSSGSYKPRVAPPFQISIDFRNKYVSCNGEHPHNLHPDPCLGGELTRVKDKCFKERDIAGLVLGMVQFGNQWTSTDAGHTEREPGCCLKRYLDGINVDREERIKERPIGLSDIVETLADVGQEDYFLQRGSRNWFIERLDDEEFVNILKNKISETQLRNIFSTAYLGGDNNDQAKYDEMCSKYLS